MIKKTIARSIVGIGLITLTALFLFNQDSVNEAGPTTASESLRKSQKLMNLIKEQTQESTSSEKNEKGAATPVEKILNTEESAISKTQFQRTIPDSQVLEKSQNFFAKIPRTHSLEGKTNADVHDIPAEVIEAGQRLAEMREFFVTNPQSLAVETSFYLECSQQKDFFESIKAICAARVSELYTKKTGRKISPLVFDNRTAVLKDKITL
jgi:hypothetical protein